MAIRKLLIAKRGHGECRVMRTTRVRAGKECPPGKIWVQLARSGKSKVWQLWDVDTYSAGLRYEQLKN